MILYDWQVVSHTEDLLPAPSPSVYQSSLSAFFLFFFFRFLGYNAVGPFLFPASGKSQSQDGSAWLTGIY